MNKKCEMEANERRRLPKFITLDNLPDDLLVQILHLLPYKLVVQFKCVNKRFLHLISKPSFLHRSLHQNLPSHRPVASDPMPFTLLFTDYVEQGKPRIVCTSRDRIFEADGFSFRFLSQLDGIESVDLIASHNDLILASAGYDENNNFLYICNPLTRQWVRVPKSPVDITELVTGLIFDPYFITPHNVSEAVHEINTGRFMIVSIPYFGAISSASKVLVFCSETGEWSWNESAMSGLPKFHCRSFPARVLAYNGNLHWWVDSIGYVVCAPFNSEWRIIPKPDGLSDNVGIQCHGICHDRLRICQLLYYEHHYKPDPTYLYPTLSVWELEDYHAGKWCLKHRVLLNDLVSSTRCLRRHISGHVVHVLPLGFHGHNGDIVYLSFPKGIITCNMRIKTMELCHNLVAAGGLSFDAMQLTLPFWPTPIPACKHECQSNM